MNGMTNSNDRPTGLAFQSPVIVGFDPAHGDDFAMEVVIRVLPDGVLQVVDFGRVIEGERGDE